jgi:hypothetical protein
MVSSGILAFVSGRSKRSIESDPAVSLCQEASAGLVDSLRDPQSQSSLIGIRRWRESSSQFC